MSSRNRVVRLQEVNQSSGVQIQRAADSTFSSSFNDLQEHTTVRAAPIISPPSNEGEKTPHVHSDEPQGSQPELESDESQKSNHRATRDQVGGSLDDIHGIQLQTPHSYTRKRDRSE